MNLAGVAVALIAALVGVSFEGIEESIVAEGTTYVHRFRDGLGDWNAYDSLMQRDEHVTIDSNGNLDLALRRTPEGDMMGAGVVLEYPVPTYGKITAKVRVGAGDGKALLMMWPTTRKAWGTWPPEIDWLEIGRTDPDRTRNTMTLHYGRTNTMIHRAYEADMTAWHEVGLEWRPGYLAFTLDGELQDNAWGESLTEIRSTLGVPAEPMKIHMALRDKEKTATRETHFLIRWVKIEP